MSKFKSNPATVDVLIEKDGNILCIRRKNKPFQDELALPGGFVDYGEFVERAAIREAKEELNIDIKLSEILGVYSGKERDPRGPIISIVFIAEFTGIPKAGDDAKIIEWIPLSDLQQYNFAFDHKKILEDFKNWKRKKGTYWSTYPSILK